MCQKILAQQGAIAYEWQVLLGLLTSTEKAVPLGRLHTRESLFHLRRCWDFNPATNRRFVRTTQATTDELRWWTRPHNTRRGTEIQPLEPRHIPTDASQGGWGGHIIETGERTSGVCFPHQRRRHINWLEIKATHLSLQHWSITLANTVVMIESDNSTTVSYLNKQGGRGQGSCLVSHIGSWHSATIWTSG